MLIKTDHPLWGLSRRALLRGAGTLVALPLLDAMIDARPARAQTAAAPKRFFAFYMPNGIRMSAWTPNVEGTTFTLPPILASLQNVRSDLLVLSGLENVAATAGNDGNGDHARGTGCFLTATRLAKTEGADIRNAVSCDQIIAGLAREDARFASLELGTEGGATTGGCDSGYSCAYVRNISWAGPATVMPKEINPRSAFDRLFAGVDPTETQEARDRRKRLKHSILDYVKADGTRIKNQLGVRDKLKLDEYMNGIREIETRLDAPQPAECIPPTVPEGIPADVTTHVRLMLDVVATAFACDLVRVSTFMIGNGLSVRAYPFIGVPDAHHEISHHGGDLFKQDKLQTIAIWEMQQLAYFLEKLKAIEEGEQNVLYNSTVFCSSECADSNVHEHFNLPVLVAGNGGGSIVTGRHKRFPTHTPIGNLFLRFIQNFGGTQTRFGDDGTSPLSLTA